MNIMQGILHSVEEGRARVLTRLLPLGVALLVVMLGYDFRVFSGLNDQQSMDYAQAARQISRGAGFTTKFIRPYALSQLNSVALLGDSSGKGSGLFPAAQFPKGKERILPDTYNAPGYPYLLGGWFTLMAPSFNETARQIAEAHGYAADHRIPWMNQIFLVATALLVFVLGLRLFDQRVAWISMLAFLLTHMIWQFSIMALPTLCLMFLCTVMLIAAVEIFAIGEARFQSSETPFWPAWLWILLLVLALGLACLTRLPLLILILPFAMFLAFTPQDTKWLIPFVVLIPLGMTVPWFWHMNQIAGNPLGSNLPLLHYGTAGHDGNQIYCTLTAPDYTQLFKDLAGKEFLGFGWNFAHAWELLGASPLVLLFFASILHEFKQRKTQAFRWLLIGMTVSLIFITNCGNPKPLSVDAWNNLVLLLPGMLVVGTAFLFILIDRLHLQLWILSNAIVVATLILTAFPMITTLLSGPGPRAYPPYVPAALRSMGNYVHKEEWITTDMPWAEAWYGDHASLWVPDSLADFNDIYDNYNSSGLLLITPIFLGMPAITFTSGEYKEWLPFVAGAALPPNFPLNTRAPTGTAFVEYQIWIRPPAGS